MTKAEITETPEQLAKRADRLYLTLAHLYQRIGKALGLNQDQMLSRRSHRGRVISK